MRSVRNIFSQRKLISFFFSALNSPLTLEASTVAWRTTIILMTQLSQTWALYFLLAITKLYITLVPEAIYGGSKERSEGEEQSPLVESVRNLTSTLILSTEIEPRS